MIRYGWAISCGGWLVLLALTALCTRSWRPRAAPVCYPLRTEPPAIVSLLAGRLRRTGYPATLMDLAARGWFSLHEVGPGQMMCQVRTVAAAAGPTTYEARVLAHLAARADAGGTVPGAALGTGFAVGDKEFREQFSAEVRADAVARGLIRRRISAGTLALLALAGLPAAALGWAALHSASWSALILVPICYLAAMTIPWALYHGYRLTPAGRSALAQWLGVRAALTGGRSRLTAGTALLASGGDRRIGYAAALGAAPEAVRSFRADERRPWSSYGGSWHRVVVGSPHERFVPRPIMLGYCVALCCMFACMVLAIRQIGGVKWAAVFALFPGVIFWGTSGWVFRCWSRARQLPQQVDFDGQVLRKWTDIESGDGDNPSYTIWCIAIDDGVHEQAWSFIVSPATYESISAGAIVHIQADPRRNRLLALTRAH
jgi:hypothetical protein